MAQKESNYVAEHTTFPTTEKEEQDKINVEKINTHIVDAKTIEVKETIQYTTKTYAVRTSNINENSEVAKSKIVKESDAIDDLKRDNQSSVESLCSSQNQETIYDDNGLNRDQYSNYDYPRPASIYENSGDESTAIYVDRPNKFDHSLQEYYLNDVSNSPKLKTSLQTQIQENSDNFQNYLRKYNDGSGSTGSTESPVPPSIKSSNDDEEELGSSTWRRNSELIESQIRQDINEIDRTLELMSLDFDAPNKFVFDENEYDSLNEKLNQISPPPDSNKTSAEAVAEPKNKTPLQTNLQKTKSKNFVSPKDSPTYSNVFNISPTINNSRFLFDYADCRCTQLQYGNEGKKKDYSNINQLNLAMQYLFNLFLIHVVSNTLVDT